MKHEISSVQLALINFIENNERLYEIRISPVNNWPDSTTLPVQISPLFFYKRIPSHGVKRSNHPFVQKEADAH